MRLSHDNTGDMDRRYKYLIVMVIAFIVIVLARLYFLQVIKGEFYHFFSTENSIKQIKIPAARGMIFDRRGQVLVENRPSFTLTITPQYVVNPKMAFESIENLIGVPREEIESVWAERYKQPKYQPLVVRDDITAEEVATIKSRKNPWYHDGDEFDLRGVDVEIRYRRSYPQGNVATHVLGYVREIDGDRLDKYRKDHPGRYFLGDNIGVRGIEEKWDLDLRGRDGYDQRIINAVGREVDYGGIADQLEYHDAEPGFSVFLTLDRDLQELARDMFGGRTGSAVALDPNTGAVLAMYSAPSYDLNILASPGADEYWKQIASDPRGYLINRAIQGAYPPGSTYKIVTGIAALAEGLVKPDENVRCGGGLHYGGRMYHCWAKGGHGPISYHRSLVHSCDVYYYTMGLRLGPDRLATYANKLGLGKRTGISLADERSGLIPTAAWKERRFGVPWQRGENLSIAVGQGYDLVTPLQNALMISQVVNGGYEIKPHLVEAIYNNEGDPVYRWVPSEDRKKIDIDPEILARAKAALAGVVQEGGTGGRLRAYEVKMGGKTGTAQVVSLESGCFKHECRDHAWFVGFAPLENPEIAAAVVVEHGGFGAAAAAPIVGAILQRYYDIKHNTRSKHPHLAHLYKDVIAEEAEEAKRVEEAKKAEEVKKAEEAKRAEEAEKKEQQAADKLNVEKEVKRASATTKPKPVPKPRVVPVAKRQLIVEQPTVQEAEIQEKKPAQRRRRKSKYHRPRARKLETEE